MGCTRSNPCGEDEGDCDHDNECKVNHKCGNNNCRSSLGFELDYDCCYGAEEDICTINNPCNIDEGDCDSHEVCQDNLVCGLNNCPDSLGHDADVDCCYNATVGDKEFCTTDKPCGMNEGHCDSDNECETNFICSGTYGTYDRGYSCPPSLGFASDVDCCFIGCRLYTIISLSLGLSQYILFDRFCIY